MYNNIIRLTVYIITLALRISILLGLIYNYYTNYMKQKPYSEDNSNSGGQDIPSILWAQLFITVFTKARY
jgi:hypothetical protein